MLKKFFRLYHTVKYLKVKQIIWRVINLFPRFISEVQLYPPTLNEQNPSNFITRKNITSDYDHFEFLNETNSLRETGWDNVFTSKLWRYNLHYFECLLQVDSLKNKTDAQISLIENWIDNNKFGKGTAWEPYPTSLRIINWIKWHWHCGGLTQKAKLSLWNQEKTLVMDNWRKLHGFGFSSFNSSSSGQDKGHQNQFDLLLSSIQNGGDQIIPFDEIVNTTKASFAAIESLKKGAWVNIY